MLHEGNNDSRTSVYPEVLVRGQINGSDTALYENCTYNHFY